MAQDYLAIALLMLWTSSAYAQTKGRLTGVITDQFSEPIANVSARLISMDRVLQAQSDTSGRFAVEHIPPGDYELECSKENWVKQKIAVHISANSVQDLPVELGVTSEPDQEYCGPHPYISYGPLNSGDPRITGVVRDYSTKKPLPNITVSLVSAPGGPPAFRTKTSKTGAFSFTNPPAGHYDLHLDGQAYSPGEAKQLLIPGENTVRLDLTMAKSNGIIACQ